ncbi:MAG: hypothetical protein ACKOXV_01380 [Bacteroidota bacterium]
MRSSIIFLAIFCSFGIASSTFAQVLYNNTSLTISNGSTLFVDGAMTNDVNANLRYAGNIYLTGNYVNNQTTPHVVDGGTFHFSGTTLQTIGGTATNTIPANLSTTTRFNNVEVANSTGVKALGNVIISGLLTFSSGDWNINNYITNIKGTISGTGGAFMGSSTSDLVLDSAGAVGSVKFKSGYEQLQNLTMNRTNTGSATIGTKLDVYKTLNLLNGSLTTSSTTNNRGATNLTLKSSGWASTAVIPTITNGAAINGNITVERNYPTNATGRAYRLVCPELNTIGSINDNYQEGQNNTSSTNVNAYPGYGTQITGSKTGANGFDLSQMGTSSMYTYDNASNTWVAIAATNTGTMSATSPYLLFLRGDRSHPLTSNTNYSGAVTLRTTGTITSGNVSLSTSSSPALNGTASKFSLVANPYPCTVDWNLVTTTGLSDAYAIYDAKMGTNGAYVSINKQGTASADASNVNRFIQPGQAFFVTTTAANPTLTFTEAAKGTASNLSNSMRKNGIDASLYFSLYQTDRKQAGLTPQDGFTVSYDPMYTDAIAMGDALKLTNIDETIGVKFHDTTLGIFTKEQLLVSDTIQLDIQRMKNKNYTLLVHPDNLSNKGLQAYLIDKYENLTQAISLADTSSYVFNVNNDSASFAPNRLMVVFKTASTTHIDALANATFQLQSNPPINNQLIWNVAQMPNATYTMKLTNTLGQEVFTKSIDYKGEAQIKVSLPELVPGIYNASIGNNLKSITNKILIN